MEARSVLRAFVLALFVVVCDDAIGVRLKELKAAYKAKESATAVRLFDALTQAFDAQDETTQGEVVKVVESAFTSRRDDGEAVDRLFIGAAAALANMGASGEKGLVRALTMKHLVARPLVLATLVEGLGQQATTLANTV